MGEVRKLKGRPWAAHLRPATLHTPPQAQEAKGRAWMRSTSSCRSRYRGARLVMSFWRDSSSTSRWLYGWLQGSRGDGGWRWRRSSVLAGVRFSMKHPPTPHQAHLMGSSCTMVTLWPRQEKASVGRCCAGAPAASRGNGWTAPQANDGTPP